MPEVADPSPIVGDVPIPEAGTHATFSWGNRTKSGLTRGLNAVIFGGWNFEPVAGIKIGEDVAMGIFRVVNHYFEHRAGLVVVFRRDQQVVFVFDGFAEFSAVGLVELDIPMWVHGR